MQYVSLAVSQVLILLPATIRQSTMDTKYTGRDGAQFTPPHDKGVTAEVLAITDLSTVKTMSREAAIAAGKYEIIGQAIDDKFIAHVKAQVVNQDAIDKMQKDIPHRLHPASWYRKYPGKTCA